MRDKQHVPSHQNTVLNNKLRNRLTDLAAALRSKPDPLPSVHHDSKRNRNKIEFKNVEQSEMEKLVESSVTERRPFQGGIHSNQTNSFYFELKRLFESPRTKVEQIDCDYPECDATHATKADVPPAPSAVGTRAANCALLFRAPRSTERLCVSQPAPRLVPSVRSVVGYHQRHLGREQPSTAALLRDVCQDQEGSRFVQNQLDAWSRAETAAFFNEVEDVVLELSTNLFGNYVVQKMIPLLGETECMALARQFGGSVHVLSTHVYGCRVVQKLIDVIGDIDFVIAELSSHVLELIASPNGNHVVQKCIDRSQESPAGRAFILGLIREFERDCIGLAQQRYGCRVLQRLFELSQPAEVASLLRSIAENVSRLINDRYGNYVIQHVIQSDYAVRATIFDHIIENAVELSKYKFSSNVIEKCVSNATREQLRLFLVSFSRVDADSRPALFHMCTDMYANYVVQKYFDTVDDELKGKMKGIVGKYLKDIKVIPFTKHILSKFER